MRPVFQKETGFDPGVADFKPAEFRCRLLPDVGCLLRKAGLFILLLAADAIVPGYSIQGLRYRCLSHCRVLLDGKGVHDPNPDDRHPWDSLMEPAGVYVIVPRDPTVLLTARQLSVEIPQPAERAAEDRVRFESVR